MQTIDDLQLLPVGAAKGTESKLNKAVAANLAQGGYQILGKNLKLVDKRSRKSLAEFDLIATDPEGRFCLIEVKSKVAANEKVENQLNRYLGFLREQSPFRRPVERVMVVTKQFSQAVVIEWKARGIEFFKYDNGNLSQI